MKFTFRDYQVKNDLIKRLVPLNANSLAKGEVRVFLWQHTFNRSRLIQLAESNYPTTDYHQFSTLRDKRFIEKLSVLLLLHQVLGPEATINYHSTGRPFLKSNDQIKISISHTTNIYAISFSTSAHGMDVECFTKKAFKVKQMFVNDYESKWLKKGEDSVMEKYTSLWSAKEAIYKLYDQPGLSFKRDIIIRQTPLLQYTAQLPSLQKRCHVELLYYPEYALTIAVE